MKPRLAANLFIILIVLNELLFVFLTLGNLFIFLGDDHDTAAEVVYIARMLWTSVGLSSVMCVGFLFGDVKFGTGLFAPMMTMLAIGMLANVCIDITELADVWQYDADDEIAVADFFLTDLLSFTFVSLLAVFTYKKQAEAEEIVAFLSGCSFEDAWSSCADCFRLRYVERVLPPLPSSGDEPNGERGGLRNRWSRLDEREASRENVLEDEDQGL
ncbi:uncharacterized protein ACA1_172140 [Acanthamoeba castellanii str. Neff]|uniref:Transmembrane protein n=1 Tax=Acanthamoeba castellanii (strain ATCC 30010 / Neff) TaxID=1257118 RepID=L8HGI0_ACACF|nr:uncharacterized protein ACA1_172140 [Acanthamoeba castellanii str. Neff]ELR24629.1 hypothetical protein ACA1_172140 [Acanthamoeba castellanii str. Neff]